MHKNSEKSPKFTHFCGYAAENYLVICSLLWLRYAKPPLIHSLLWLYHSKCWFIDIVLWLFTLRPANNKNKNDNRRRRACTALRHIYPIAVPLILSQ